MKKFLLALLLIPTLAFAQPTPQQQAAAEHKDNFCKDMAGMAIIMTQFRDQGIDMKRAVSELQKYLDEHPDFPATPKEKEYAITVIKTIYKFPTLRGDNLGNYIYDQCNAQDADL
jgi:hypothetical protein